MKKKYIVALVIIVAALSFFGYRTWHTDKKKASSNITVVKVERGNISEVITSQGKLEAKEYVDVGAQVSGQLKKLHVDIGDEVKQGDLIAEIDPRIYQANVQGDEAALKTLQAQLLQQQAETKLAELQYERNVRLYKTKAVSQDTLQTSETNSEVAKAKIASLQAQIEQAQSKLDADKANLGFTQIYAPMDGTIVTLTSREGQTLNANQTAPVIVQVANLNTMTVRAQVAEADILNLNKDMDVYFTILGNAARKWNGKIRQIQPSPETVNEVVLYDVLIDVDNADHQLMTGMTTQMFFVQGKSDNAVLLPIAALARAVPDKNGEKGDAYVVNVLQGKRYVEKLVYVGLTNRTQAEVTDGLSDTDTVAIIPKSEEAATASGGKRFAPGPRL